MKQKLILILTFLLTLGCFGQREHLEPAKDFSQYEGILKDYYNAVFRHLNKGFSEVPYVRYAALPSFSREYSFSIEQKNDRYIIISNWLSQNFWYAQNRLSVKLMSSTIEIKEDLYEIVGELFQLLAKQTKKPTDIIAGSDGTIYYFTTVDSTGKIKIGKTWSPDKNSNLHRLVKICDELFIAGQGGNISDSDIKNSILELIIDLQK
jgi:hypothetical protein